MTKLSLRSRALLRSALGTCLFIGASPAVASPSGGAVTNGAATINQTVPGQTQVTQTSNRAVINWSRGFNLANGESFEAIQPNATSILLNRDTSGALSSIDGSLTSNGRIWIINPQGMAFGSNARVKVGGLLASSLDVGDGAFMSGSEDHHLKRNGTLNFATISAANGAQLLADGTVAFVSSRLAFDSGSIIKSGGQAIFGTGSDVYLKFVPARDDDLDLFSFVANGQTAIGTTEFEGPMSLNGEVNAQQVYAVALDRTNTSGAINILGTLVAEGAASDGQGGIILSNSGGGVTGPSTLGEGWFRSTITSFYSNDGIVKYGGVRGEWLSVSGGTYQGAGNIGLQTVDQINSIGEIRRADVNNFSLDNHYHGTVNFNNDDGKAFGSFSYAASTSSTDTILNFSNDIMSDSFIVLAGSVNAKNISSKQLISIATYNGGTINVEGNLTSEGVFSHITGYAVKVDAGSRGTAIIGGINAKSALVSGANVTLNTAPVITGDAYAIKASSFGGKSLTPEFTGSEIKSFSVTNTGNGLAALQGIEINGELILNGGHFALSDMKFNALDAEKSTVSSLVLSGTIKATDFGVTTSSINQTGGSLNAETINLVSPYSFAEYNLGGDNFLSGASKISVDADYGASLSFKNVGQSAITAELNVGGDYFDISYAEKASLSLTSAGSLSILGDAKFGGGANINVAGDLALIGNLATLDADAVLSSHGWLTISGRLAAQNATLAASGLTNSAGASAISVEPDDGHWVIYLSSPTGNSYGGLDSGQTALWNASLSTNPATSIAGNRYVFAYSPTLTVTPASTSKTYGDVISSGNIGISVTGVQTGVAGAYLGDTADRAFSGTASAASLGFDGNANVGSGSYAITVDAGTLTPLNGYQLSLTSGTLTVTPKALNAVASVFEKTYDGSNVASGQLAVSGILFDDEVAGSATYAFADKNAGTGKSVSVTGLALTGADAGNYTLTAPVSVTANITPKALLGSASINTKTYDGTTGATGLVGLSGLIAGDAVSINGVSFAFTDKNAGTSKLVNVTGGSLTGADAGNYTLQLGSSAIGAITQRSLGAAISATDKTYDGTTAASGQVTGLMGVVTGDNVSAGGATYAFASKNAGTGLLVTATGLTLSGSDAGNYVLTGKPQAVASILAKSLVATIAVSDKTYDGTTGASGQVTGLTGVIAGDSVAAGGATYAFGDKKAGTGKAVAVTGLALSGSDAGNYVLTVPAGLTADIRQKALTGSVAVSDKTYDGTTKATGQVGLTGVVTGDDVATSGGVFTFTDKNAGSGKLVSVTGVSLAGTDAGNYTLSLPESVRAAILQRMATILIDAQGRAYDGTAAAAGSVSDVQGLIGGDDVSVAGGSYAFADKNAGTGKVVTGSGFAISGDDAGNYTFNLTATAFADVLQKALTATTSVANKTYDGTATASGSVSLAGVVSGDAVTTTNASYAFADKNAGTGKSVSVTGLALTGADAGNYTLTAPVSVTANITPRPLTIIADDAGKMEGSADPLLPYTLAHGALASGDSLSGTLSREPGEAVGSYAIEIGNLYLSDNYDVKFVDGIFRIVKRATSFTVSEPALAVSTETKLVAEQQRAQSRQNDRCAQTGDDCFTVSER